MNSKEAVDQAIRELGENAPSLKLIARAQELLTESGEPITLTRAEATEVRLTLHRLLDESTPKAGKWHPMKNGDHLPDCLGCAFERAYQLFEKRGRT